MAKKKVRLSVDSIQDKDLAEIDDLLTRKYGKNLIDEPSVFRLKQKPKLKNKERKKKSRRTQSIENQEAFIRHKRDVSYSKKKLAQKKITHRRGVRRAKNKYFNNQYVRKGL